MPTPAPITVVWSDSAPKSKNVTFAAGEDRRWTFVAASPTGTLSGRDLLFVISKTPDSAPLVAKETADFTGNTVDVAAAETFTFAGERYYFALWDNTSGAKLLLVNGLASVTANPLAAGQVPEPAPIYFGARWGGIDGDLEDQADLQSALDDLAADIDAIPAPPVSSVNGQTGAVTLDAGDVGADPAGTSDALAATLGTASTHDVPASGNAASGEVVLGSDSRLTDARTPTAHSHGISDVTGLQTALDAKASSSSLSSHTGDTNNPHNVTASQVGLGNVDNTSDADKPVSTATQTALDARVLANDGGDGGLKGDINISGGDGNDAHGGQISTRGGEGAAATGGNVYSYGGSGLGTTGGNIRTYGGTVDGANGGDISTNGGSAPGGSIRTSDGGGSIDTTGTGIIELGLIGTRTTLTGTASVDCAIAFPDAAGTLVVEDMVDGLVRDSVRAMIDGDYLSVTSAESGSLSLSGWNTSTASRTNFLTITNVAGTPTCDIADSVTKAGQYIYRAGGTDIPVTDGGTGTSSATAYAVLCGGTTSTGAFQSVASVGSLGQVLTSNGAGALPSFQTVSAGATNLWIPASAMIPRVTNGPGVNSSEGGTNRANYDTLDFDTTTQEYAQFMLAMPSNYSGGTVTARFFWTADSGIGTVQFQLAGRALSDDDAIDTARGTAVGVSDTLITAGDLHRTAATSAITIAGTPAANALVLFEVSRDVGSDNLGVDARLLGVEVSF